MLLIALKSFQENRFEFHSCSIPNNSYNKLVLFFKFLTPMDVMLNFCTLINIINTLRIWYYYQLFNVSIIMCVFDKSMVAFLNSTFYQKRNKKLYQMENERLTLHLEMLSSKWESNGVNQRGLMKGDSPPNRDGYLEISNIQYMKIFQRFTFSDLLFQL